MAPTFFGRHQDNSGSETSEVEVLPVATPRPSLWEGTSMDHFETPPNEPEPRTDMVEDHPIGNATETEKIINYAKKPMPFAGD